MKVIVSNKLNVPIYEQIYEQIVAQILRNEMNANESLPSIRSLALELGISVITIKKAWEKLEQNGFIYTMPGKGCFVNGGKLISSQETKFDLARNKIAQVVKYCENLELTKEEIFEIIEQIME